ncbi:hypothetical protein NDU88_007926 [Pleurodeles waltl]|uniref:Uncharacterized protein n=1 Tax=Pleurodeles waltl TaxID=8319 RepID=A0AAV7PSV1_PLEWA|nr:hypothetical protein NDU88_007926 [Pleurodeles waltl]
MVRADGVWPRLRPRPAVGPGKGIPSPCTNFLDHRLLAGGSWSIFRASVWGMSGDLVRVGPVRPVRAWRPEGGVACAPDEVGPGPMSTPGRRQGEAEETVAAGLEQCVLGSSLLMPVTSGGAPGLGRPEGSST